jgi:hypothetical protein
VLVDGAGREWACEVHAETRNDLRLQYTLRGRFAEWWDAAGVAAGDVLAFRAGDPRRGVTRVARLPGGAGLAAVLAAAGPAPAAAAPAPRAPQPQPRSPPPHAPLAGAPTAAAAFEPAAALAAAARTGPEPRGAARPDRWAELPDGSAVKTVYRPTLLQGRCPAAGWLLRRLYGEAPRSGAGGGAAPAADPRLGRAYAFDLAPGAAGAHHLAVSLLSKGNTCSM